MAGRLLIIACMFIGSISASSAQTPSPDAMTAARSLVTTMKLADQYKALLPAILLVATGAFLLHRAANDTGKPREITHRLTHRALLSVAIL